MTLLYLLRTYESPCRNGASGLGSAAEPSCPRKGVKEIHDTINSENVAESIDCGDCFNKLMSPRIMCCVTMWLSLYPCYISVRYLITYDMAVERESGEADRNHAKGSF